jgi:hypothetical protein
MTTSQHPLELETPTVRTTDTTDNAAMKPSPRVGPDLNDANLENLIREE